MRWNYLPLLLIVAILTYRLAPSDSSRPDVLSKSNGEKAQRAGAFIDQLENNEVYWMGIRPKIDQVLAQAQMKLPDLFNGCLELLQNGSTAEKTKSARFLGILEHPAAIKPLIEALADPQEDVRESACYALRWLDAKGQTVEPALTRLCRGDASIAVRVAAAVALGGTHEEDRAIAYQLGLQSPNKNLWQVCENKLEAMDMLKLPLPEHIYTEIPYKRYQEIKANPWYGVERETNMNDTIYLELHERAKCARLFRQWYKTKVGS